MMTRGPSVNAPIRRPGSAVMTPRISNVSRADQDAVADLQTELRQQFGPHERAASGAAARASRRRPAASASP